nr:nef protein [Human immunodeficiency virus 1]
MGNKWSKMIGWPAVRERMQRAEPAAVRERMQRAEPAAAGV